MCKIDLKKAYFSVPPSQKFKRFFKFQVERSILSVSLSVLGFWTSPKQFPKVSVNSSPAG